MLSSWLDCDYGGFPGLEELRTGQLDSCILTLCMPDGARRLSASSKERHGASQRAGWSRGIVRARLASHRTAIRFRGNELLRCTLPGRKHRLCLSKSTIGGRKRRHTSIKTPKLINMPQGNGISILVLHITHSRQIIRIGFIHGRCCRRNATIRRTTSRRNSHILRTPKPVVGALGVHGRPLVGATHSFRSSSHSLGPGEFGIERFRGEGGLAISANGAGGFGLSQTIFCAEG